MWQCIIHSINCLKNHVELDLFGDEKSWVTSSYGEAGAGLTGGISNKPGITKGDQKVLVSEVHRMRPCAYRHRHKVHVKPPGWNLWVNTEAK